MTPPRALFELETTSRFDIMSRYVPTVEGLRCHV
jgi:hypothetical protein